MTQMHVRNRRCHRASLAAGFRAIRDFRVWLLGCALVLIAGAASADDTTAAAVDEAAAVTAAPAVEAAGAAGEASASDTVVIPDDAITAEEADFFEKKIRPVLVRHCYECHSAGGEKIQGGFSLDTRSGIRLGGESGPAVVPHKVDQSLLVEAIRHDGLEMPPKERLPQSVVDDFEKWIEMGAPNRAKARPPPGCPCHRSGSGP